MKPIAIIDGVRTPFCKAGGVFQHIQADDLAAFAVKELIARTEIQKIDTLIFGNVLQPTEKANIARVIAMKAGLPSSIPSFTVNRNCASGMDAVVLCAEKILLGQAEIAIAGGVESMSHFPIYFSEEFRLFYRRLSKAKNWKKLKAWMQFRLSFLYPKIPRIADPLCGLTMGETAELLSREFGVTREEQDLFALESHNKATKALKEGILAEEIVPIPIAPSYETMQLQDDGIRVNQTLEELTRLNPCFDPLTGSITAGTSSQVTDGATALILMSVEKAKDLELQPLGYLIGYESAALEPERMGLGPLLATEKLLSKMGMTLSEFDRIEINEAFAAQVIAVTKALGGIDPDILNANGGAIAFGHPLGASGARLILTLLKELKRKNLHLGLATLCAAGGQGKAVAVKVEP